MDWKICMPSVTEIQTMAELKMVLTKCAQTQREGACCWWPRAQAVCRAAVQTGPTSHLQSECLMHRAGFSCAASPSSGLGHLQIHGCLKQETATQSGCYTTDEEGARTFLSSLKVASMCLALQKLPKQMLLKWIECKCLRESMCTVYACARLCWDCV